MSHEEPIEPGDEELARLLDTEKRAKVPEDALARVWSRLGPVVPSPDGHTGAKPAAHHGWLAQHALPVALASFVGGMGAGAALYATVRAPPLPSMTHSDAPPALPDLAPTQALPSAVASIAIPPLVAPAPPSPHASAPASQPESLRAERDVLDHARSLLTGGDASGALASLDDHASHFPKPQLAEEREALAIQSLVALGRYDEARARAKRFHEASPSSLFAPVIDAAIGSIP